MKYESKKHEADLYSTRKQPQLIQVPMQAFLMLDGAGNPNQEDFAQRVGVLYSLAYTIKMQYKQAQKDSSCEYDDFTVFPLEGIWTTSNPQDPLNKEFFQYTIMIKQPFFITKEHFENAMQKVLQKKPHPLLDEVRFASLEEGLCVQMLHIGPFDEEAQTFAQMDSFAQKQRVVRMHFHHKEIYLSDPRKTAPEKSRTILRYQVR